MTAPEEKEETKTEGEKMDPAVVKAVAERLEFFLSDANLRQDVFLRKVMLSTEGEYPQQVTPEVLLRFNTIKKLTMDPAVVIAAAKTLGDRLELSADEKAIGLKDKFTMEKMDDNIPLSLFVDEIPLSEDGKTYNAKPDEIRELFDCYGKVAMVKLRFQMPHHDKKRDEPRPRRMPAGSAFVEFATKEDLEKAATEVLTTREGESVEAKRKLEIHSTPLKVMLLKEYVDTRKALKKEKKGTKRDDPEGESSPTKEGPHVEPFTLDWKPGCVIRLEGLSTTECDRESLLDSLASGLGITAAQVKERKIYVDYSRGQDIGALRFPEPSDDIKAMCDKLNEGDVKVKEDKVKLARILEGEEETKYWNDFIEFKNKQKQQRAAERSSHKHRNKRFRR